MATHPMLSRFLERMRRQLKRQLYGDSDAEPEFLSTNWHEKDMLDLLYEARGHTVAAETERQEMMETIKQGLAEGNAGRTIDPKREKLYREQIAYHCAEAALYLGMIADNAEMNREILPCGRAVPEPCAIAGGE